MNKTFAALWPVALLLISAPARAQALSEQQVITQALADRFGANIAEHPEDWHMLQPQWLADLSDERRARLGDGRRAGAQRPGDDDGTT